MSTHIPVGIHQCRLPAILDRIAKDTALVPEDHIESIHITVHMGPSNDLSRHNEGDIPQALIMIHLKERIVGESRTSTTLSSVVDLI